MIPDKNEGLPKQVGSFFTADKKTVLTSQELGKGEGGLLFNFEDDLEDFDDGKADLNSILLKLNKMEKKLKKQPAVAASEEREKMYQNVHQMMLMRSQVVE